MKSFEIDLSGSDGNAYALISYATGLARQLEWDSKSIKNLQENMMSADYDHLLDVFKENFGEFVMFKT